MLTDEEALAVAANLFWGYGSLALSFRRPMQGFILYGFILLIFCITSAADLKM